MTGKRNILCLCGGVGGAKLAWGLSRVLHADELLIVVNTGDDFTHLGLAVCPDLDSVMYALAGLDNPTRGWGVVDDSGQFMRMLAAYRAPAWFQLGDKDLATHVLRTQALRQGVALDAVTRQLADALGIAHRIVPMSNDPVATMVNTAEGQLAFQDYFVRRQCKPAVRSISFKDIERAKPQADFQQALAAADAVIICPSNPYLSIAPIIALPGVGAALAKHRTVFAVSPIIQGRAIKGPTAKMMCELGLSVSNAAITMHYADLITCLIIDESDQGDVAAVQRSGIQAIAMQTLMQTKQAKITLANDILRLVTGEHRPA